MSRSPVAVHLPEDVYERVRRAAKGMRQSVETALVNIVKAATPSLEKVPIAYRQELEAIGCSQKEEKPKLSASNPKSAVSQKEEEPKLSASDAKLALVELVESTDDSDVKLFLDRLKKAEPKEPAAAKLARSFRTIITTSANTDARIAPPSPLRRRPRQRV
jgi:hypothetical protein